MSVSLALSKTLRTRQDFRVFTKGAEFFHEGVVAPGMHSSGRDLQVKAHTARSRAASSRA